MTDQGYGRLGVLLVALFIGLPVLGLLVGYYVDQFGGLPFTFRPGPFDIPPWAPLLGLLAIVTVASVAPILLRSFRDHELTFHDQIRINRRNSVLLTIAIVGGLGLTAYILGTVISLRTTVGLVAGGAAILTGLIGAIVSDRAGDRIVLRISRARPLAEGEAVELRNVVNELSIAADIPPPTVHLIEDSAPNAFAIGRGPGHAALAVTSGLLETLDREELQGVVAHEVAHIRNEDSRYNLFVAILVGVTVLIADGFFRVVTFPFRLPYQLFRAFGDSGLSPGSGRVTGRGSGGGWSFPKLDLDGDSSSGKGAGAIVAVVIFIILVLVVSAVVYAIAPVFARLTQATVSREREYLADASAVELGRNPDALERALMKVASSPEVLEAATRATAPLYFVNPIRAFEKRASAIFSTHPRTIDRVNRLRTLQGEPPLGESGAGQIVEDVD